MLELLTNPDAWIALATLTLLEIVLGIDNIVFIAILASRLPVEKQAIAYRLGLLGAMVTRVALLMTINWVMQLTDPLFEILEHTLSGRDLILLGGGLFLIAKSTQEMYEKIEGKPDGDIKGWFNGLPGVVAQIMILDVIFSLDSVITAVGMAEHIEVMVTAIVIAIGVMLLFAKPIGDFVNKHPSMKILALSFLLLIGVLLTAEGLGQHINKGYIYFAMAFALIIELLNIRFRAKQRPA
ncbi:MAG: TerC family protein [Deltaproteobacteria bacterium]|nr:TerC family protein [Deltaproteobacteria bacterium]MBW2188008.1 TerC family protein [Deltaproteobacteria bacterium]MBW2546048.1 TerC family protein [Deltaproteobacteria bacterium]MBW2717140.1 TerC family protein [Deltaproteobacteria bacterium]RLB50251.1 MAG: TerC family protein [Deltaproteobacteria bacterium]